MAGLSYPLVMPATPGIQKIKLSARTQASMSQSPFTGSQQVFEWPAEWWEAEVTLPPMRRAAAEAWNAFLCELRGRSGTFFLGDSAGKTAQGTAWASSSAFFGPSQTGKQMALTGMAAGFVEIGDYIQTGGGASATRIQLTAGSNVDGLYYTSGTSINTQGYITSVRVKNWGANTVVLRDNLGNSQNVISGAETTIIMNGTGDGVSVNQLIFGPTVAGNSLDFIAWAPRIQKWNLDENQVPIANQNFTGWTLGPGRTLTLTQNYNQRLYKALGRSTSFSGHVNVDVFPRLRGGDAQLDTDLVTFTGAKGIFRLQSNLRGWDVDEALIYGIQFNAVEAL